LLRLKGVTFERKGEGKKKDFFLPGEGKKLFSTREGRNAITNTAYQNGQDRQEFLEERGG